MYQAIKTLTQVSWVRTLYWVISLSVYGYMAFEMSTFDKSTDKAFKIRLLASLFLIFVLPKIFLVIFLLIDDILRMFTFGYQYLKTGNSDYVERRKFLSLMGLGLGALFAGLFTDGIFFGKFRHKVRKVKLKIAHLPNSFKGYKILQISDVHSGSFSDPAKLQKAIHLINEQNADLIVFTGDMVNTLSSEFKPFIELFSSIQSKDGKLSVLGNHDYGDYHKWENTQLKQKNFEDLLKYEKQAGFDILLNENRIIEKNGEKIYILGVENWGLPPFPQYGDLEKSMLNVPKDAVKILMSHDPTHFDEVVKKHPSHVHITLSGHTHGMQFGIDLKNIKWSPAQFRYKKWADLYESNGRYLYVNRGFGVIGYPGRVGVLPEITVFELS